MQDAALTLSRDYDLPPSIVWDALIDPDLVEGWLAFARIEPFVGGAYDLRWLDGRLSAGSITDLAFASRLGIATDDAGELEFELSELPDGTRGSATRLTVRLHNSPDAVAEASADWNTRFDQLESLLRGHPVDWSTWQADHGAAWARYFRAAASD